MSAYPNAIASRAMLPRNLRKAVHLREREEDRPLALEAVVERIAADADQVRDLAVDNIGWESPVCDDGFAVDLLIALRELRPVFDRLTHGAELMDALKTADDSRHFQTLLRAADIADTWIAGLISEKAAEEVDAEDEGC